MPRGRNDNDSGDQLESTLCGTECSVSLLLGSARTLDASEPAMVQPYRAPNAEALARVLTDLAPGDLSWGVLTTSGAEAVEAAIKIVRSRTGRPLILSATGSFHGKTMGALALSTAFGRPSSSPLTSDGQEH